MYSIMRQKIENSNPHQLLQFVIANIQALQLCEATYRIGNGTQMILPHLESPQVRQTSKVSRKEVEVAVVEKEGSEVE